jgi:integrase
MATVRKRKWMTAKGIEETAWVVDYVDQLGRRRLKTLATKKEADAWAVTTQHEISQGIHTPASASVTVAEATDLWIKHCEAEGLEFGTIKQRRQHLNLHIAPFIGREKLSSLSTPRVHAFDSQLRNGGRSLEMRRKVLTNVKTMLTFAQGRGLVAQNVDRGVRIKGGDRHKATAQLKEGRDFPSKAELRRLIDGSLEHRRPFLITAIFTGMRASELRGLRWSDIDLGAALIHVAQRADAWGHIGSPKSAAGTRDIPCTPLVVNALRQWRLTCPASDLGLVFPSNAGQIASHPNTIKRFWNPLQIKCGLVTEGGKARYDFHCLRHAAASLFIEHLGWSPKRIQTVMGHSSITMTFDRYGHLFENREGDAEALKKLEAAVVAA